MKKKEFLTEKNYESGKNKIKTIALIILIGGILLGGGLIMIGLIRQSKVNFEYSEENKQIISQQLETERQNLISKKAELEAKIEPVEKQIKQLRRETFTGFDDAYYERQDKIEELEKSIATDKNSISVINDALDESFGYCKFNEAKNNMYTSKYCSLKLQLDDFTDFKKSFASASSIPFYIIGAFIIFATCITVAPIYIFSKRREIVAFTTQQVMPVAQEGIEKMAPTIGSAAGTIGKELAKGIKEGINEADNNKN